MTPAFFEFLVSSFMQCFLLLLITRWISERVRGGNVSDGLWTSCYLMILLLWCTGFLLPHLRFLPIPAWVHSIPESTGSGVWSLMLQLTGWIWLSGVGVLGMALGLSLWQTSGVVNRARDWMPDRNLCGESVAELLTAHGIRVRLSSTAAGPFCWQFHHPVIVLPESILTWPVEELQTILRHEIGHLISGHPFQLFLQRLVEMLFWMNPFVWKCSQAAAIQRELVADHHAARDRTEVSALLQGLLRLAEIPQTEGRRMPAGLNFASRGSFLELRVAELLRRIQLPGETHRSNRMACLAIVSVAGLTTLLWLPVNPEASDRSVVSPWPSVSATALKGLGISVRDFEIDGHRTGWRSRHQHDQLLKF